VNLKVRIFKFILKRRDYF